MDKIKVWYPEYLFNKDDYASWFELLKSKKRFQENQSILDVNIQELIEWVEVESQAEIFILPLDWNYYYNKGIQNLAIDFCKQANSKQITVISSCGGDQGITVPVPNNTIVYRQSGYRSKKKNNERTAPFYLSDPISNFIDISEELLFEKQNEKLPVIGFCGMAPHGKLIDFKEQIQIIFRNLKSKIGLNSMDLQEIMSSSNLRYTVLSVFKNSEYFQTNYIIRQSYRGGIQTPENRKKTTDEYYNNQYNSDFIVCARGGGNFSVRFYETLAMGRIPLFIDTDSPLPDLGKKDWKDYIVWIDRKEINRAPEITREWLKSRNIKEQKIKNRKLWLEHFKLDQFWRNELLKIVNNSNDSDD
jgi:hypothetical protein